MFGRNFVLGVSVGCGKSIVSCGLWFLFVVCLLCLELCLFGCVVGILGNCYYCVGFFWWSGVGIDFVGSWIGGFISSDIVGRVVSGLLWLVLLV